MTSLLDASFQTQTSSQNISVGSSQKLNESYDFTSQKLKVKCILGKGSQALVALCKDQDNQLIATKIISHKMYQNNQELNKQHLANKLKEIDILKTIEQERKQQTPEYSDLDFLLQKRFFYENESYSIIGLDYCPGGELLQLLKAKKSLQTQEIRFYASNIILGLNSLHQMDIIYKDLKPENVMIDKDGYCKLCDYGLSFKIQQNENVQEPVHILKNDQGSVILGTLTYLPPEFFLKNKYNKASDFWALGCLLYQLACGNTPFMAKDQNLIARNIIKLEPNFDNIKDPALKDLIKKLLIKDQSKRIQSFEEIKNHLFFSGFSWDDITQRKVQPPFVPINILKKRYEQQVKDKIMVQLDSSKYLQNPIFFNKVFTQLPTTHCQKIINDIIYQEKVLFNEIQTPQPDEKKVNSDIKISILSQ